MTLAKLVDGIGEKSLSALSEAGISKASEFMDIAQSKKGRKELAAKTGLSEKKILTWTNHLDMQRVKGIGRQWSELLELAGVDTVAELKMRKPENLHQALADCNQKRQTCKQIPSLSKVEDWVNQAKALPKVVTH